MKKIYFETQDFNGMIITDGEKFINLNCFPDNGTIVDAKNFDCSGIEGYETIEEIEAQLTDAEICNLSDIPNGYFEVYEEVGEI